MDLLLQAAKVLEQENSGGSHDRATARSTRGISSHQHGRSRGMSLSEKDDNFGNNSFSSILQDDNAESAEDDSLSGSERRRAGGAGTREVHNQLEKNRRKQMRECFNYLQQCIPSLENKRVATQSILQGAIKHIKSLKKKNVEQEREIQMLAKRKSELKRKHDVEFNKCTEDEQRLAEAMLKMRKPVVNSSAPDEDGHTSDSTTTASEGPGNEDDFSDEEKVDDRERGNLSRVNPVVAAKLDGFRKRKLATQDSRNRSTDYIIASMKDAGLLTAAASKPRSSSLSSVSSSSLALKNMLEQKKKQQSNHFTSATTPLSSTIIEKPRIKAVPVSSKISSSGIIKSSGSSLISSHPMISNQLAAMPSLPSIIPPLSLQNKDAARPVDNIDSSSATSLLQQAKAATTLVPSFIGQSEKSKIGSSVEGVSHRSNSIIYAPSTLMNTVLDQAAALQSSRIRLNSIPTSLSSESASKMKSESSASNASSASTTPSKADVPFDFSSATISRATSSTNPSPLSVFQPPISSPVSETKVLPSVIPMSFIRGLPLNSGLAPMAMTLTPTIPSSSSVVGPVASVVSPLKVGQPLGSEILLTSPVKSDTNTIGDFGSSINRVTALLAQPQASPLPGTSVIKPPSTFLTTIPTATNVSSTVAPANMSLQDTLKTMAIAPTLLPFTMTGMPLSTSAPQAGSSMTPALRFFSSLSSNSVVAAAPLSNGQTTAVVPLGVRLNVLQNFIPTHVQVQSPQMIAQPIVVVTAPNSIINSADSAAPSAAVVGTQPSVSSSSIL